MEAFKRIFPYAVCKWGYLYNEPGCAQQDFHSDGESNQNENVLSFSVVIAIMDESTITLVDHQRKVKFVVDLPIGSMLIFPCTFEHAGSTYSNCNFRVFVSMDVTGGTFESTSQNWTKKNVDMYETCTVKGLYTGSIYPSQIDIQTSPPPPPSSSS
jgi:hypothetical protein